MIYFDNAATTYPKPDCVYDAVNKALVEYSFNAGRGAYSAAQKTFRMIEETRNKVAALINESGSKVIFTSSATESLNNIIYGLGLKNNDTVFVSPFEHNAVIRTLHNLGVNIFIIPFSKDTWELDRTEYINQVVMKRPKAIILSQISNVTGYELPYEEIFSLSKRHDCLNILDCSQGFGIFPVNKANVDFLIFAGHKSLYSIFGIAGYINISNYNLKVYKVGGTGSDSLNLDMPNELPYRYEAGSMNSVATYALNKSLTFLAEKDYAKEKIDLTKYLIERLKTIHNIEVYLPKGYVSKGIVSINVEGFTSDEIGMILAEDYDICVRTGHHCAPFISEFLDAVKFNGTVRISLGIFNTREQIDKLIAALKEI